MIYIVEDDENIRQMEEYALKNSGYEVAGFPDGAQMLKECEKRLPQLFVLDIMLPGEGGLEILKRLKADTRTKRVPVVMVTAKDAELDTVRGLDLGADDYLTKPFGVMEFVSRVKAVLRRAGGQEDVIVSHGGIVLDDEKHIVTADGRACELTYKEYELLKYMLSNRNIVLSRDKIMDRVWGVSAEFGSRTVDMHIKTLRQKLGGCGGHIKTVRNVGYKLE